MLRLLRASFPFAVKGTASEAQQDSHPPWSPEKAAWAPKSFLRCAAWEICIEAARIPDVACSRPVNLETFLGDTFTEGPEKHCISSDTAQTSLIVFSRKTAVCHGLCSTIKKITGHFLFFCWHPYNLSPVPVLPSNSLPDWKGPYLLSSTLWLPYVMKIISSVMWKYCFIHVCTAPSTKGLLGAGGVSKGYWNITVNMWSVSPHTLQRLTKWFWESSENA